MKITQSTVTLASSHQSTTVHTLNESLTSWGGSASPQTLQPTNSNLTKLIQPLVQDQLDISEQAKKILLNTSNTTTDTNDFELSDSDKQKIRLIESILSVLAGKKVKLQIPDKIHLNKNQVTIQLNTSNKLATKIQTTSNLGWGINYQRQETYRESETLGFAGQGVVQTADGRKISFDTQLLMSRQFSTSNTTSFKAGDALKDPLVINFDAPAAQLSDSKINFDINQDGKGEQISFLKEGSGFLALDKNGDGVINNGSELFGATSGDGFGELAQYDSDQNGWIDENDPIFNKLQIWTKDSQGDNQLLALGAKGVGAIYVGHVSAEFKETNSQNDLLGASRSAGIFLRENGTAGIVQQVDLVV